ncbi:hypothetical protein [Nocardiopsis sp. FR4]|uniref:hypothetical protein n=1 Tax=Nocardiopsis sp. FR4 TaxID=2605985 RepID=UPI00135A5FD6|nr:hypothetical protein [Nocardiopsis sp. FR4]
MNSPIASDIALARLHRRWGADGVVADGPDALDRLTVTGAGTSQITIAPGYCVVGGWFYRTDSPISLNVAPNEGAQPRRDLVVIRANTAENACFPHIIQGTPGGSTPTPTRDPSGRWDLPLAEYTIAGQSAVVSSSDVNTAVRQWTAPTGAVPCTSGARPAFPHEGMLIYETDTGRVALWSGNWITVSETRYPTPWQPLLLRSGYSQPNHGQSPAWRWDAPDVVRLRGRIDRSNGDAIPHRAYVARVPAEARPRELQSMAVTTTHRRGSTASTRGVTSRLEIHPASRDTAGRLFLWTIYNPSWVGLDGVTYAL